MAPFAFCCDIIYNAQKGCFIVQDVSVYFYNRHDLKNHKIHH